MEAILTSVIDYYTEIIILCSRRTSTDVNKRKETRTSADISRASQNVQQLFHLSMGDTVFGQLVGRKKHDILDSKNLQRAFILFVLTL